MENIVEEWRDIIGYEGLYQISNLGRVRSLNYHGTKGKIKEMVSFKKPNGYYCIGLRLPGESKKFFHIHRLVAQAFIPNPDNLPVINHKDCNPANNVVSNIEWCTQSYNTNYEPTLKKRSKTVAQSLNSILVAIYPSLAEASRQTKIRIGDICRCCKGQRCTAGGFTWCYA